MSSVVTSASLEHQRSGSARDEGLLDYRERRVFEALERAAVKRQDHAAQCLAESSADVRIRAWEKVHHLRMPSTLLHPVLQVIAAATQLSLAEVRYEQHLRAVRRASADL